MGTDLRMTPKQLQAALDKLGLSQVKGAKALGINERTMRRYIAGELPIPRIVVYDLERLLEAGGHK
jgi:hypothetical protein